MQLEDLSVRAYNCLQRHGIKSIEDLCNMTPEEIMRVRNLGRNSLTEILEFLKKNGLRLREM